MQNPAPVPADQARKMSLFFRQLVDHFRSTATALRFIEHQERVESLLQNYGHKNHVHVDNQLD
jgi:hypothetical protein